MRPTPVLSGLAALLLAGCLETAPPASPSVAPDRFSETETADDPLVVALHTGDYLWECVDTSAAGDRNWQFMVRVQPVETGGGIAVQTPGSSAWVAVTRSVDGVDTLFTTADGDRLSIAPNGHAVMVRDGAAHDLRCHKGEETV